MSNKKSKQYTGRRAYINGPPSLAIDAWKAYYYAYQEYDLEQYNSDDEVGTYSSHDLKEFFFKARTMESIACMAYED